MAEDCTPLTPSGGCDIAGLHLQSTGKRLPKDTGGGHEFVTELPETGDDGVEYVLMDDISDCSTYRGTYVYNKDCGGWIQTSGSAPNNNSLLLTRPDLWTPGTEYDFGGGLYGQRFTGTITTTGSSTMFSGLKILDSSLTNAHIVNSGGVWDMTPKGSNYSQYPLGHSYTALETSGSTTVVMTSWLDVVQSGTRAGLNFCVIDNAAATTNYDVWCTYTK